MGGFTGDVHGGQFFTRTQHHFIDRFGRQSRPASGFALLFGGAGGLGIAIGAVRRRLGLVDHRQPAGSLGHPMDWRGIYALAGIQTQPNTTFGHG
jgi:hypothetical protein